MNFVQRFLTVTILLLTTVASGLQTSTTGSANLRAVPSATSKVLVVIPKATELNVGSCLT